jgi:hypothetical protein
MLLHYPGSEALSTEKTHDEPDRIPQGRPFDELTTPPIAMGLIAQPARRMAAVKF